MLRALLERKFWNTVGSKFGDHLHDRLLKLLECVCELLGSRYGEESRHLGAKPCTRICPLTYYLICFAPYFEEEKTLSFVTPSATQLPTLFFFKLSWNSNTWFSRTSLRAFRTSISRTCFVFIKVLTGYLSLVLKGGGESFYLWMDPLPVSFLELIWWFWT